MAQIVPLDEIAYPEQLSDLLARDEALSDIDTRATLGLHQLALDRLAAGQPMPAAGRGTARASSRLNASLDALCRQKGADVHNNVIANYERTLFKYLEFVRDHSLGPGGQSGIPRRE